jgi:periplasmic protein CpxP/Spy
MDIFSRKHFANWIVALLVVLNVATLGALWLSVLRRPEARPRRDDGKTEAPRATAAQTDGTKTDDVRLFLERELGLSPDQKAEFERLRTSHAAGIQAVQAEIQRLKKAEMDAFLAGRADDATAAAIGAKETEKEKLLYAHLRDLMAICRPEQQERFRQVMGEILRLMAPKGGQPQGDGSKPPRKESLDRPRGNTPDAKPPHRPGEKPKENAPPEGPDRKPPREIR